MEGKRKGCLTAALCVVVFGSVSCGTVVLINGFMSRGDQQQPEATEQTQTETLQTQSEYLKTQTEPPSKSIDNLSLVFVGEVPNDVTGNLRYSTMTGSDANFPEYAILYYQKYMRDKEVHAVINEECGHTIRITNWDDYMLDVAFLVYRPGEENDASELFGGDLIDEYIVTIGTGDIEIVEPEADP